jgi:hypothetical protein
MVCGVFLELHHVVSRQGSRAKLVLSLAQQGNPKLIIGPGGPQRLLILCGNPPPKAAGSFSLLPWGRSNDRTLCGGRWLSLVGCSGFSSSGGIGPPSSDNLFSRYLGGDPRPALAGDTRAEGGRIRTSAGVSLPPARPPPSAENTSPKRLNPKTRAVLPGRPVAGPTGPCNQGYEELPRRLLLGSP